MEIQCIILYIIISVTKKKETEKDNKKEIICIILYRQAEYHIVTNMSLIKILELFQKTTTSSGKIHSSPVKYLFPKILRLSQCKVIVN